MKYLKPYYAEGLELDDLYGPLPLKPFCGYMSPSQTTSTSATSMRKQFLLHLSSFKR